jgi:hypothetical protein
MPSPFLRCPSHPQTSALCLSINATHSDLSGPKTPKDEKILRKNTLVFVAENYECLEVRQNALEAILAKLFNLLEFGLGKQLAFTISNFDTRTVDTTKARKVNRHFSRDWIFHFSEPVAVADALDARTSSTSCKRTGKL